ncbi:MAG: adenosylcobinamide-phosphate synthase CbiB [Tannerella sp.]|jgi:adenosylcobinamide-phosphate synthase|nr:adenosylcobinamide-phosphate synthase CbiB [Tannerella sp.]
MEKFLYLLIPLCAGWILDKQFGDPSILPHPVVFFGRMIASGEQKFNHGDRRFWKGAMMSVTLIAGTFLFSLVICSMLSAKIIGTLQLWIYIIVASIFVFYCLAGKTLMKEVREVFHACDRSLENGRRQVSRIVGRDTSNLSGQEVRTAALETLAENMSDGVIAPLFWYMLLGIPGMLAYKMINTLDSMIGYRNERFIMFGRLAARIDDFANYIPARLTALLMILVSGKWSLFPFVFKYGKNHLSPNSGYPEAALAGILNCRFGGPHDYFGETVDKPYIGANDRILATQDMKNAIRNAQYTELLAIIICIAVLCRLSFPA